MALKLVFAGSDAFSCPSLEALLQSEHEICAVITQPDRPAGRGRKLTPNPLKALALTHNLEIFEPKNLKDPKWTHWFQTHNIDAIIVIAYGRLIPASWLETPPLGCINVHASLLPAWRGASPIQQAILHGDQQAGVCIMDMEKTLDTGAVYAKAAIEVQNDDTAGSLHEKLSHLGATLLIDTLKDPKKSLANPEMQDDSKATFAPKITKACAQIDWTQSAISLDRMIRGYNPWPIAWSTYNHERVRIWEALPSDTLSTHPPGTLIKCDAQGLWVATGGNDLIIKVLQWPGKTKGTPESLLQSGLLRLSESFKPEDL